MSGAVGTRRDPAADLSTLLAELQLLLPAALPASARRRDPAKSGWSVGQHLDHLLRAAALNLRAITAIERGRDDGPEPPLGAAAKELLDSGRIPRGVADSPAPVRPREESELEAEIENLAPEIERQLEMWGALEPRIGSLPGLAGRITHPLLGSLDAADWLRFARVHTHHHRLIIEEILAGKE